MQWRHNGKENGIADLSGNVSGNGTQDCVCLTVKSRLLQTIMRPKLAINLGAASTEWKAIDGETGNLVTPDGNGTTVGTIKYANGGTADYTINGSLILVVSATYQPPSQ